MRLPMIALLLSTPVAAQDFSKVEVRTETLAPGIHVLFGAGGNVAVSTGPDGTVLIDDDYPAVTPKIVAAARTVSPAPIRFLINTHWHGDHTGGNELLGKGGTIIVAHDNVRTRMGSDQFIALLKRQVPASPVAALPVVTFASEVTLHLNGEDIHALHVAAAHTDGDSLVHFTRANVIHMGDIFFSAGYPLVDQSSGGRMAGVVAAVDKGLALGNATTRYIPGHGPVTGRAELVAYRAMIVDIVGKVAALVKAGRSVDAIVAAKPSAAYDAKWGGGFMKPDVFVRIAAESAIADIKRGR